MIAGLRGKIVEVVDNAVILDCHGIHYEVLVPVSVAQRIDKVKDRDDNISLITYHYLQMSQTSAVPMLVGFLNNIERDFFLEFIKVSGIGPRAAVKALSKSIGEIAQAIDQGDTKYLTGLQGIGAQRAKEIVAKLQGKMGKFTLMQDAVETKVHAPAISELKEEALVILQQLQYKKAEAENMIEKAFARNQSIKTSEDLLNEIYKQRSS